MIFQHVNGVSSTIFEESFTGQSQEVTGQSQEVSGQTQGSTGQVIALPRFRATPRPRPCIRFLGLDAKENPGS